MRCSAHSFVSASGCHCKFSESTLLNEGIPGVSRVPAPVLNVSGILGQSKKVLKFGRYPDRVMKCSGISLTST
jgi:hypothetical protein